MYNFLKIFPFIFLLTSCQGGHFFGAYRQAYRDVKDEVWMTYSQDIQDVGWTSRNRELRSPSQRYCYRNLGGIDCYAAPRKTSSFLLPVSQPRVAFKDRENIPMNYFVDQNGDKIFYDENDPHPLAIISPLYVQSEDHLCG